MNRTLAALVFCMMPVSVLAQDYDGLIRQAVAERNAGHLEAAEGDLRQAYNMAADKREAAYLLALVMAFQEKYEPAVSLLDKSIAQYPDDVALRLARARVMAYQGRYTLATNAVDDVLGRDPDNLEARNLAARIALYEQKFELGRSRFQAILADDPDNLEALIGMYDSERDLGNNEAAQAYLARAKQLAPEHADVRSRERGQQQSPTMNYEVLVGFENSTFNKPGYDRWLDRFVELRHFGEHRDQQYLRLSADRHFGLRDQGIEAGLVTRARLPLSLAVRYVANPRFLPSWTVRAGTSGRINEGKDNWGASVGQLSLQYAKYLTGPVTSVNLDIDHYFTGSDSWVAPGVGLVNDENGKTTLTWRIGINGQVSEAWRLGADYTHAPETENNVTTDSHTVHCYARVRLGAAPALRLDYARIFREGSYRRDAVSLTFSYRFRAE